MRADNFGINIEEETKEVDEIISENDLMDRPGTKIRDEFEEYEENTEEEPEMMERGIIHFLPIVEKILSGEITPVRVDPNIPSDEFFKKHILGIK